MFTNCAFDRAGARVWPQYRFDGFSPRNFHRECVFISRIWRTTFLDICLYECVDYLERGEPFTARLERGTLDVLVQRVKRLLSFRFE